LLVALVVEAAAALACAKTQISSHGQLGAAQQPEAAALVALRQVVTEAA
jgi:hypothetical protein